ncbi:hypothetical protein Taro_045615 [Colocasia esculenta]|uniref:RNase H type-1 domain-containing protein n=1 Tax=Colocasia esculenta TaxID=4460 RepID=A0A843X4H4_COLES|nr:hypothetical protein [Colocasia esculenta]
MWFVVGSRWIHGKGDRIDILNDTWYGDRPIAEILQAPLETGTSLQEVAMDLSHPLRSSIPPHALQGLYLTQEEDKCIWAVATTGEFSTRSTYDLIRHNGISQPAILKIWHHSFHPRASLFCWKILNRAVPVDGRISESGTPLSMKLVRWIPPLVDFCLNVDGASKGNLGICGGGGCIRDKHGKLLLAFSNFYGVGNSIIAETRALCDGLRLAHFLGVRLSAIYSDSSTLVQSIQQGKCLNWHIQCWWRPTMDLLHEDPTTLSHVFKETNQVADRLANHAISSMCNELELKLTKLE